MMGSLPPEQNALFYDFCLDKYIPSDHLLREIDRFLDFSQVREQLDSYYSHTGRPSIDPELLVRMLIVGYCYGIRSERRLCEEVNFNLAYRWFCKLGLEGRVPDHSTFSKTRHGRFRDADIFRFVFDAVVTQCQENGLIKGEGFAIDASFIRADVSRQRFEPGPVDWSKHGTQNRAVKEYLSALDETSEYNRPQKSVSLTDPMAQWSGAKGPAEFYYSTNYLIDVDYGVIMDVEASPSTLSLEVGTTKIMLDRVEAKHGILPDRLMGDSAYGAGENLEYLIEEKDIEPHIPVVDREQIKDGIISRSNFKWNEEENEYRCPEGKPLRHNWRGFTTPGKYKRKDGSTLYRARKSDCSVCLFKEQCCPNRENRVINRSAYEKSRDVARAIVLTDFYNTISFHERKKVEMVFAHMKVNHNFMRLRLRGIKSANDEMLLVATTQNLKKLAKYRGQSPPDTG